MPVGFKNGTGGSVQIAVDAVRSSAHPHIFLSVTKHGLAAIVSTAGNPECHVILRGGTSGPNFSAQHVGEAVAMLAKHKLQPRVMVDCSHANSGKLHTRQIEVARDVAAQIEAGNRCVFGVMVESHLQAGAQKFTPGKDDPKALEYGKSITDACIGWNDSLEVLDVLSQAVRARRN
jgi:3-deoxy-7-phosphoheptulonate synthase